MRWLLTIIVLAAIVYGVLLIIPDATKSRLLAAVGLSDFSLTETIINTGREAKDAVADKIIPKSPAERRAELIERLEQSLTEIKEAQEKYGAKPDVQHRVLNNIEESEEIVKELKQENEKTKESALGGLLRAASEAITSVAGTNKQEVCEVVK